MNEIARIIRRAREEAKIRSMTQPKECFLVDHDYVQAFCDPWMAREYYKRAEDRICFECRYWFDEAGCQKPFGLKHLISIVKGFVWRLKWRFPPLDWLYCYHYRLMRRCEAEI